MSTMMYDKVQKKTVALLTAIMVFLCQCIPALASSVDSVQVRSAPLAANAITKNGMVRVYLSSLGNPSSLDLTVNGSYSLSTSGEFIASGSKLRVGFDSSSGSLTVAYNGQTLHMGQRFSIRRHSTAGSNGILIAQSRDSQNPYPGDLSFEAVYSGGSYKLYTIAHVYIEDYLYGVLPYEMGNSSGMEALKAQAVAARTYTVRMMERRASNRYDVVDTTSDQVYRGTPSGNANCVSAVDATKGIVLMFGSDYITTYYSASNGGQTETARSGSAYAYMKVKDDPFDYANPSSTVKKKTVYTDLGSASNPSALISLLKSKAVSSLKRSGYPATDANTTLKTLKAVTPHTPMYDSPSRLYTKMDFTFTVSTQNTAGQAVLATLTETCDIFSELESMLGLGIQSLKNELWSVKKTDTAFVLQARRYGHGMGMSQRGAMYMAKLGYTYDQILGFYYEGCNRVSHSFTSSILSAGSGDQQVTVVPPAEMEQTGSATSTGTVTLTGNSGMLAIRSAASAEAAVIGTAGNGALVEVLVRSENWCQIRFGEIVGYVPTSSLVISGTPAQQPQDVTSILGFAVVTANDFVNLRASGSMSAKVLGTAPTGAVLTVLSQNGSWAKVQYQALTAYANINYISAVSASYPSDDLTSGSRKAKVVTEDGTGTVNLRRSASTNGQLVDRLPVNTIVTVLSDDGSWSRVIAEQGEGYILSSFLQYVDEEEDTSSDDAETVPPPEEEEENETTEQPEQTEPSYAVVNTVSGSLNLRAEPWSGSGVLTTIPKGAEVTLLGKGEPWSAVRYGSYDGFVMTRYLSFASVPDEEETVQPETGVTTAIVVTPGGTLNLRALPHTGARILERIPAYTSLVVLERGAAWCKVNYLGTAGYVMSSFLSFDAAVQKPSVPETEEKPSTSSGEAYVNTQSGSLNLRTQPSLTSGVITAIPQYASVMITAYGTEWCSVRYDAHEGYVLTRYLGFESGSETPPKEEETTQTTMYVVTDGGSLNLRSEASGNAQIVTTIPQHAQVLVFESGNGWSRISWNNVTGYVMTRYLKTEKPEEPEQEESAPPADEPEEEPHDPYITIGGVVLDVTLEVPEKALFAITAADTKLYSMCSENGEQLLTVPSGAEVEVLLVGDLWCRVAYQNEQGYCPKEKLNVR